MCQGITRKNAFNVQGTTACGGAAQVRRSQFQGMIPLVLLGGLFFVATLFFISASARADDLSINTLQRGTLIPVPSQMIYRGMAVESHMLTTTALSVPASSAEIVDDLTQVLGKVATRALLPGRPIALSALSTPPVIERNTQVTLVYRADGLVVTARALAMRDGRVGDTLQVRNIDSGQSVFGTVQTDGTVLVGGG